MLGSYTKSKKRGCQYGTAREPCSRSRNSETRPQHHLTFNQSKLPTAASLAQEEYVPLLPVQETMRQLAAGADDVNIQAVALLLHTGNISSDLF